MRGDSTAIIVMSKRKTNARRDIGRLRVIGWNGKEKRVAR